MQEKNEQASGQGHSPRQGNQRSLLADGLAWVRLERTAAQFGLSQETSRLLKSELSSWLARTLGFDDAEAVAHPSPQPVEIAADQEDTKILDSRKELELRLRHLVDADAPFDKIRETLLTLYQNGQEDDVAARGVELAFLHGSSNDVLSLFEMFFQKGRAFYWLIHSAVRSHIVARFWQEGLGNHLAAKLMPERWHGELMPMERLFLFRTMLGAKDASQPYQYFRKYREQLLSAVNDLGEFLGITPGSFLLQVAKMAIGLGYDDDARMLVSTIREGDAEYAEAMTLLLSVRDQSEVRGISYADQVRSAKTYEEKLVLLADFLATTRKLGGVRDVHRAALNELLADPLELVPQNAEAWFGLSRVLVENRDLVLLLPHMMACFKQHALNFSKPLVAEGLWAPWLNVVGSHQHPDALSRYWAGVGKLHHYLTVGPSAEADLWRARDLVGSAAGDSNVDIPYDWEALHKEARSYVTRDPRRSEADRDLMMQQLRLAVSGGSVDPEDIVRYLHTSRTSPRIVLERLQSVAHRRNRADVELKLLARQAHQSHYTNKMLNRVWELANALGNSDLAWRVASVAHARQSLSKGLLHPWTISGERRQDYPLVLASSQAVEFCMRSFDLTESRFAHAILEVGGAIPEVLAILDPEAKKCKRPSYKLDTAEARIDKHLDQISWVPRFKKRYVFSQDDILGAKLPAFMHVVPANFWSALLVQLAERFGVSAWNWQASRLFAQIEELVPRLAYRQGLRGYSAKMAKWLKGLTPEQRSSWQDLTSLSKAISDQEACDTLAVFLCRMATVMYQNHFLALSSLRVMRVDLPIIYDLECWILSEEYSQMREKLGTASRVPVPASLARMATIIES